MAFLVIPRDQPRRGRVCDAPRERPESKRSGDRARGWCGLQRRSREASAPWAVMRRTLDGRDKQTWPRRRLEWSQGLPTCRRRTRDTPPLRKRRRSLTEKPVSSDYCTKRIVNLPSLTAAAMTTLSLN